MSPKIAMVTLPIRRQQRRCAHSGKIALVTVFTLLIFALLILFVANSGVGVSHKIELQNAADATAYSSALWEARALNAITTTNHLMGELTAITVVLDSFGGTMLGQAYGRKKTEESEEIYNDLAKVAPNYIRNYKAGVLVVAPVLHEFDKPVVDQIVGKNGLMTRDRGEHSAGAAIYDAKLALQTWATMLMSIKGKANLGLDVAVVLEKIPLVQFLGYTLEGICLGVHVYMTIELAKLGKEWFILQATESGIAVVNSDGIVRKAVFEAGLPALSLYADGLVGSPVVGKLGEASSVSFMQGMRGTQESLASTYSLQAIDTIPAIEKIRLPVIEEEPPPERAKTSGNGLGPWEYPESEWKGNFTADKELRRIRRFAKQIDDQLRLIRNFFRPYQLLQKAYDSAAGWLIKAAPLPKEVKKLLGGFKEIQKQISGMSAFDEMAKKEPEMFNPGNPCLIDDYEYRIPKFYWEQERKSQWVRATYPYVDEYRAPIIDFYREWCPLSNFATYYSHWSNRYTLANSYLARKRDEDSGDFESDQQKGLLAKLRKKVAKLRKDFEAATDDTDEENAGVVDTGKFEGVSKELQEVLQWRSQLSSIPGLAQWFGDVEQHRIEVSDLATSMPIPSDSTVPTDALRGLAEEMALINALDDLLTLLEELVELLEIKEPHMYVLQAMEPESKGVTEPWLNNTDLSHKLFCLTIKVSKDPPKLFGAGLFKERGPNPSTAYATAMVYNANGRNLDQSNEGSQPNTGWDTLNWQPPVRAPEWGNHKPSQRRNPKPWQILSGRTLQKANRVKVNWQVKLAPQHSSAIQGEGDLDSGVDIIELGQQLITH